MTGPNSDHGAAGNSRPDTLPRLLSRQHGVLSLSQAKNLGLAMSTISHRIRRGGPWQRMFPGVYLSVSATPTTEQLDMAAQLYAGDQSVITGLAALRRYGFLVPTASAVDVLVPVTCGKASRDYVRLHRTARMPQRVGVQGQIRLAMPPRAVVDATQHLANVQEMRAVVAGAVQQGACTPEELQAEVSQGRRRCSIQFRAVLAEVVEGIRSAPEGDLMDLIKRAGLPTPLYNVDLYLDGAFLARPDAWWREVSLAAEVDSRAYHSSVDDWQRTMRRHTRMTVAGVRVLHFSPSEIRSEPHVVISRITQALQSGVPNPRIKTGPAARATGGARE